jgi:hypothetical protein
MTAFEVQKTMNKALANGSYKKAYKCFLKMTELRAEEGLPILTMPNLQKKFN